MLAGMAFCLFLNAQEPVTIKTPGNVSLAAQNPSAKLDVPAKLTLEELTAQVTQLEQTVAQKDQQIAAMQAQLTASGKMFSACFQSLAEAEQRAAKK